jgi:hypothetical protein
VSRRQRTLVWGVCLLWLAPAVSLAQVASGTPPAAEAPSDSGSSLWLVAGGAFATLRGDCQTCEQAFPYRHAASVLADVGYRVNRRADIAVEIFWMPFETSAGRLHATHLDFVGQFRPWASKGFFLKGGAGMVFVRNWVDTTGTDPFDQNGLSVVIGAGWAFRPAARVGFQLFGTQHAGALGDLQSGETRIDDVMGNFWSLGAALTFR